GRVSRELPTEPWPPRALKPPFSRSREKARFHHGLLGRDSGPLQIGQAQQVVGCPPHISHLLDLPTAHMTHLPQSARLLQPTEDLFHLLAHPLADLVGERLHPPQHPPPSVSLRTPRRHPLGRHRHVRLDLQVFFHAAQ